MGRPPTPGNSRAVLIGTPTYERRALEDLPTVESNVRALYDRLTGDLSIFSADTCVKVIGPRTPKKFFVPVQSAIDAAQGVLLVYFAGHGLLNADGELYLGVRESHEKKAWTSVRFADLANEILRSRAQSKIVILDCCYSGRAMKYLVMGGSAKAVAAANAQLDIAGLYVLTSSSGNKTSRSLEGEDFTAFTGRLLKTIDAGIPDAGEYLTMESLYTAVRGEMRRRKLPAPQQHAGNSSGQAALFTNRARVPSQPPSTPPPPPPPARRELDSRWKTAAAWVSTAALTAGMGGSLAVDPSIMAPCAAPISVGMLVPLDTAEMFRDIADAYQYATRGGGDCQRVSVNVSAASQADVARAFALSWETPPNGPERDEQLLRRIGPAPDVWIADLTVTMTAVQSMLQKLPGARVRIPGGPARWPTAESPVVLAGPGDLGTDPAPAAASSWGELVRGQGRGPSVTGVVRPDPDTTTVGSLVNLSLYPADDARTQVQQRLDSAASAAGVGIGAPDTADLLCRLRGEGRRTGLIVAEWQVARYNIDRRAGGGCGTAQRNVPLSAWYPQDTTWLDYPLVEPEWSFRRSDQVRRAAHDLTTWMRSEAGARAFADHGLRPRVVTPRRAPTPGRSVLGEENGVLRNWGAEPRYEPTAAALQAASAAYKAAKKPASVLVAVDGSGSMGALSGRRTRFAAAVDGVVASIDAMGERDALGLFIFSTVVGDDIADVAPLSPGTAGSRKAAQEAKGYQPAGGTPLYRAIDNGVRVLREDKRSDDRYRVLVVLTDGEDTTRHALPELDDDLISVVVVNVGVSGCPDPRLSALTSAHGACVGVPSAGVDEEVGVQIERLWHKKAQ